MGNIKLNFDNMGIANAQIAGIEDKIAAATKAMDEKRHQMAWRDLPHNQTAVVEEILAYVAETSPKITALVVLGIGGSALGPIALQQALHSPFYNHHKQFRANAPRLFVLDNIDPATMADLFALVDLNATLFSVVSKSGATSETMAQFMLVKDLLEQKMDKEKAKNHIVCTTDSQHGNLIKIAKTEGYKTFHIPVGVGGRFSQLCPVGLLPAAFTGLDIKALLKGAADMDKICQNADYMANPAFAFAIYHYLAMEQGKNITVMMPYVDRLKYMSDWFAQLWAESLGKDGLGQTPAKALGATDQHSQVQLYVDGPRDKVVVFLGVEKFDADIKIPKTFNDMPAIGFLGGHSFTELLQVSQKSTEYALTKAGCSNMTITMPQIDEYAMGQLFYMLEVATAFTGELMGINAFDQPGVEEGKNALYRHFGKPGF
ncbi:MAG: glucose-6-phosphate isomerase [Defluviitaleaceae bacterium]|nr:glucose-6-phosphate isomerase [Defluviitaleaceae bacterium]